MHLFIEHETIYRYAPPARFTTQYIRLTPRQHGNLQVWSWNLTGPRKMTQFTDGFGNIVHVLSVTDSHDEVRLKVLGEVWTQETSGVLPPEFEAFNPLYYANETPLTAADAAIREFAEGFRAAVVDDRLGALHDIMAALHKRVRYKIGATDSASPAAEAFAKGEGVCQDHAHVFLSVCRVLGLPSRYISGYFWADSAEGTYDANHAWAEAFVENLGWVSFDVANCVAASDAYVRVAQGRDYLDAAPVRGLWRGDGAEELTVSVRVSEGQQQQ
ncbi:MAG: transglutaminase family protein, partial [Alphaproteobacteria bacterium]|nr:transglutaminase family protein [Alphaproteobacteria bacterium]